MRFRPCIDIHNGCVKQIVGSSLSDETNQAKENFVSTKGADYYGKLYKDNGLYGGHIAMLNSGNSAEYEATKNEAKKALRAFEGGLQIGGGINADNGAEYIEAGASHIIVTSYAFHDGEVDYNNLNKLRAAVGKEHIVLDLSCRFRDDAYYIVTDRWQKYTNVVLNNNTFDNLAEFCDEFLVHGVDVEGKKAGIDEEVVRILAGSGKVITYAGGISSFEDIETIKTIGNGNIDFTIGSALDIFGGKLDFKEVIACTL